MFVVHFQERESHLFEHEISIVLPISCNLEKYNLTETRHLSAADRNPYP